MSRGVHRCKAINYTAPIKATLLPRRCRHWHLYNRGDPERHAETLESSASAPARYGAYAWNLVTGAYTTDHAASAAAYGSREAALVAIAGTGATRRMPERPLTIATYAAGASLAAITLVYCFGPTFFLDDEAANSSRSSRKKGVVGLANPANDCFINSVLQALSGLPELRLYLIRETHRRRLDGPELYKDLTAALEEEQKRNNSKQSPEWKLLGLQQGRITAGLKEVIDALNERPIYKKTISAQAFIRVVEDSFKTRINRTQQDAQEFLQLVAERLADEHFAARRVRRRARRKRDSLGISKGIGDSKPDVKLGSEDVEHTGSQFLGAALRNEDSNDTARDSKLDFPPDDAISETVGVHDSAEDEADGPSFPLEGKLESQVECSHCHFKPKPSVSSFVSLTLHVPHDSTSTTLNACFDGLLKIEHIDDFICDKCRLEHALQVNARQLAKTGISKAERVTLEQDSSKLEIALREDPEEPPKGVKLPDSSATPKRRIARHTRISDFPRVLAIHLSRSVWDPHSSSSKNMAKVAFPELLPLGGLLDRKTYRLLSVVSHKGGHNSGHYETYRRQFLAPPISTPASMGTEGIYSLRSTPAPSPRLGPRFSRDVTGTSRPSSPATPELSLSTPDSPSSSSVSSRSFLGHVSERRKPPPPTSVPLDAIPTPGLPAPPFSRDSLDAPRRQSSFAKAVGMPARKRKVHDRWWRISDDKVKESKTSDVLSMQREVYLLFYEVVDDARA
ncbi:hypothetical protein LTR08_008722 [Meristemomyces frigidus]|nr:hypothetical protein LTR08_008722 [Meristemomyces frigidus]